MADGDNEQLVLEVLAKIGDIEKNMKKSSALTAKAFTDMKTVTRSATKQMEQDVSRSTMRINQAVAVTSGKIGDMGRAFAADIPRGAIAAAVSLLSLTAILGKAKAALEDFGDIADKSGQAGLDPETFQAYAYQASLAGVALEDLSGALNSFAKNSGLAVAGKGKMVAGLKALNPVLLENIRNAETQEERFRLAADAIDKAKTAAEKAALASTLFGNAGAAMVPAFAGGADALDRARTNAQQLGVIVSDQLVKSADQMGDELDTASQIADC